MTLPQKLRVGLFVNDLNTTGGIQRVAVNLANDLRPQFDTCLITMCPGRKAFNEPNIPHYSLDLPYDPGRFYPTPREMIGLARRLRRLATQQQLDVVICIWFHLAILGALALPSRVIRIGYEHIAFSAAGGRWAKLRRWTYPRLDAVVSLAQDDGPQFARIARRAEVIPNYVRLPGPMDFDAREKIILAVGHIEHRKGLDRLLWALQGPLQSHPDWRLVFVGGGETGTGELWYIQYLHALIGLLDLGGRVALYPATPHVNAWYRRASMLVMGSRLEGFPLVLLEAKSHGLPIIAYDCPTGPKEIIRHGTDGFLVNTGSEFSQAADALLDDPGLRRHMSECAIEDVRERFAPEIICRRWQDLIFELQRKRSPAQGTVRWVPSIGRRVG